MWVPNPPPSPGSPGHPPQELKKLVESCAHSLAIVTEKERRLGILEAARQGDGVKSWGGWYMSECFTSPNYWGYNLQQIFKGDVQNPQKGTFTNTSFPTILTSPIPDVLNGCDMGCYERQDRVQKGIVHLNEILHGPVPKTSEDDRPLTVRCEDGLWDGKCIMNATESLKALCCIVLQSVT